MKTLFLALAVALLSFTSAFAQSPTVSTYLEQTKMGAKLGYTVGVTFKNQYQLGGFYQKDISNGDGAENVPRHLIYEQEFYGVYFSAPLKSGEKFGLSTQVRTGVTNGENFTITPSLLGSYRPVKFISLNAGLGIRAFRPTAIAGISLRLSAL
ncbi:hypothetical protein [Marinoscillum sp. MHG1-6]|uniref:hypothetical protein n=1 Tax=Marinoscillum sp. MHG1-6 TaxID=2959627 RepID=UPI002157C59D|nr:hypothetical protein [Marinoscillum sp. MHG1-6]